MNTPQTTTNVRVTLPRRRRNRQNRRSQGPGQQGGRQPPQPNKQTTKTRVTGADLLSPCARDYLSVLENPFSGKVACVPQFPSIPSRKVRYWAKGVAHTGTAGVGFVALNPFVSWNEVLADPARSVYYTGPTFAGTTTSYSLGTTGVSAASLNSEYISTSNYKYRLVAAGLRVRYAGTELNRGGRVFCLEEPDHATTSGFSMSSIGQYDTHRVFRPDQQWKSVTHHPADEDEFDYFTPTVAGNLHYLLIMMEAADAATTLAFEWEVDCIYELIGPVVRGLTPTPVDMVGLSAVQTFANTTNNRAPREGDRSTWVNYALNHAGQLLWQMGSGFARAYFDRPLMPRLGAPGRTLPFTEPVIELVE